MYVFLPQGGGGRGTFLWITKNKSLNSLQDLLQERVFILFARIDFPSPPHTQTINQTP